MEMSHIRCIGILIALSVAILISGCTDTNNAEKTPPKMILNEADEQFFDTLGDLLIDLADIANTDKERHGELVERIDAFERFAKDSRGHEFAAGHVLGEESTLQLWVYLHKVIAYNMVEDCDNANLTIDRLIEFTQKDFLVIDFMSRYIYDVGDEDYEEEKRDSIEGFFIGISFLNCYDCRIRPDLAGYPDKKCYRGGK